MRAIRRARWYERPHFVHEHLVWLVRHAEPFSEGCWLRGRSDPPGEWPPSEVPAAAFDRAPPCIVVSSPRRRTLQAAIPIARRHRVAIAIDDRLDDVDYGAWTGLSPAEIRREWPDDFNAYRRDPASVAFPGGESLLAAQSRACDLLADMAVHRLGPAAVVTHDVIARLLLGRVSGYSLAVAHATPIERAVTALDVTGGAITLAGESQW